MVSKSRRKHGELEGLVLNALWHGGEPKSASELLEHLASQKIDLAHTTLLTVLSRLIDKELVQRTHVAKRGYLFRALESQEEITAKAMLKLLEQSVNPKIAMSFFAKGLELSELRDISLPPKQ
jgi:predicted transcriptional regulator